MADIRNYTTKTIVRKLPEINSEPTLPVPNLSAAQTPITRADAHVAAGAEATVRAKPDAGVVGRALLDFAGGQFQSAHANLAEASSKLVQLQMEVDGLGAERDAAIARHDKLHAKWYAVAGRWIEWALIVLVILLGVHVFGGIAALFIPGAAGAWLAWLAAACNPLAWFQSARDNAWFQRAK
jgi:hypothetical protein